LNINRCGEKNHLFLANHTYGTVELMVRLSYVCLSGRHECIVAKQ